MRGERKWGREEGRREKERGKKGGKGRKERSEEGRGLGGRGKYRRREGYLLF